MQIVANQNLEKNRRYERESRLLNSEVRLWVAVILQALQDAMKPNVVTADAPGVRQYLIGNAYNFLSGEDGALENICYMLDLNFIKIKNTFLEEGPRVLFNKLVKAFAKINKGELLAA